MQREPIVQGDVMLFPVDALPEGATLVRARRHTLALGEVTGHAHVMDHSALYERAGERLIVVAEADVADGAVLDHEDHGPIPVAPHQVGVYRVIQQTEPDLLGGVRNVAD